MNGPTDDDSPLARLQRIDRWLVCGAGAFLLVLGTLGVVAVFWSRHTVDVGPGDPTLAIVCLVLGAAILGLGLMRLR